MCWLHRSKNVINRNSFMPSVISNPTQHKYLLDKLIFVEIKDFNVKATKYGTSRIRDNFCVY